MNLERHVDFARSLFREANDAFLVFNPGDHRIVDLNPAALRLTGFDRKDVLEMRLQDLFQSNDPDGMRRPGPRTRPDRAASQPRRQTHASRAAACAWPQPA